MRKRSKNNVLVLGLVVFISSNGFSQHDSSKVSKNELGLEMSGLIFNHGGYGLLYKRSLNSNLYFRASLYSSGNFGQYPDNDLTTSINEKRSELQLVNALRLGLEKRKPIRNNKAVFYWGMDVKAGINDDIDFSEDTTIYSKNWGAKLLPFVGVKYFFFPQLSLSCEFDALSLGYIFQTSTDYYPRHKVFFDLNPSRFLLLSYHF